MRLNNNSKQFTKQGGINKFIDAYAFFSGHPHRDRVQVLRDFGLLLGDDTRGATGLPGDWSGQGVSHVLRHADDYDGDGAAAAACQAQRHLRADGHGEAVSGAVHQLSKACGNARRNGDRWWTGQLHSGSADCAYVALGHGEHGSALIR